MANNGRINPSVEEIIEPGCMNSCNCANNQNNERTIGFNEFFEVMKNKIAEERRISSDIIFESSIYFKNIGVSNVTCFLCPFTKDAAHSYQ